MLTIQARSITIISICFSALVGCSPAHDAAPANPFCAQDTDVNESCRHEVGENEFWLLSSNPKMPVERPLKLRLRSAEPLQMEQGTIRGLSMYMGRIPLVWQRVSATEWEATLQLGACTDPNMVWQLQLILSDENGRSYEQRLPFSSTQPD